MRHIRQCMAFMAVCGTTLQLVSCNSNRKVEQLMHGIWSIDSIVSSKSGRVSVGPKYLSNTIYFKRGGVIILPGRLDSHVHSGDWNVTGSSDSLLLELSTSRSDFNGTFPIMLYHDEALHMSIVVDTLKFICTKLK